MSEATKSFKNCGDCDSSEYVLRLMWIDYYPEGSRAYDNHICLGCGRYVDQSVSLSRDSLIDYRIKYGSVVGIKYENVVRYPKRNRERNTDE